MAISRGDLTSAGTSQAIEKVISADLESIAPDVVLLLQSSQFLSCASACVDPGSLLVEA